MLVVYDMIKFMLAVNLLSTSSVRALDLACVMCEVILGCLSKEYFSVVP
jgi:hypothetical protein